MEAGANGADGTAENSRGLGVVDLLEVAQDEDLTIADWVSGRWLPGDGRQRGRIRGAEVIGVRG